MSVASAINSTTSSTCVHEASLLSRTPSWAEIDSPLAHMPGNPEIIPVLRSFENKRKFGDLQLNTASRIPCSFLSLWYFVKSAEQHVMSTLTSLFVAIQEVDFGMKTGIFL